MNEFETGTRPTLNQLVENIILNQLLNTHTVSVGHLISYDENNNKAVIQIDLKRKTEDGVVVEVPPISQVPVFFVRSYGGTAYLNMPLKAGDTGIVLFCERSIDIWTDQGGVVDPKDARKFDYSDAIFIPGLYPSSNPINDSANSKNVVLKNDQMSVILHPDGKIEIKGATGEVMSIISDVLQTLINSTVIVPAGISVSTTGTAAAQTGATTAPGIGSFDSGTIGQLNSEKSKIDGMTA